MDIELALHENNYFFVFNKMKIYRYGENYKYIIAMDPNDIEYVAPTPNNTVINIENEGDDGRLLTHR